MAKKASKKKRSVRKKAVSRKSKPKRKASVKKKSPSRKKTAAKKGKAKSKKLKAPKPTPKLPNEPIGRVTHYFSQAGATAIMIEKEGIQVGDTLYFKGHTTRLKQKVESLQINREPVTEAGPGDEVGIAVGSRTREHDLVFKL